MEEMGISGSVEKEFRIFTYGVCHVNKQICIALQQLDGCYEYLKI